MQRGWIRSATNRGPDPATLPVPPTLWCRHTWAWDGGERPVLRQTDATLIQAPHPTMGDYWLACDGASELLFTDNESNAARLWGTANRSPHVKDGINDAVVLGRSEAVNPDRV